MEASAPRKPALWISETIKMEETYWFSRDSLREPRLVEGPQQLQQRVACVNAFCPVLVSFVEVLFCSDWFWPTNKDSITWFFSKSCVFMTRRQRHKATSHERVMIFRELTSNPDRLRFFIGQHWNFKKVKIRFQNHEKMDLSLAASQSCWDVC